MQCLYYVLFFCVVETCYFKPEFNTNLTIVKKIFATLCLSLFGFVSFSQNPISSVQILPTYPTADSTQLADMDADIRAHVETGIELQVALTSVTDVDMVVIKVGLTEGGSDLFYREFDFDSPETYPDGTSYARNGNTLTLGIGDFQGYGTYHTEVSIVKGDGSIMGITRSSLN